jgi:hypothetical protein
LVLVQPQNRFQKLHQLLFGFVPHCGAYENLRNVVTSGDAFLVAVASEDFGVDFVERFGIIDDFLFLYSK